MALLNQRIKQFTQKADSLIKLPLSPIWVKGESATAAAAAGVLKASTEEAVSRPTIICE